MCMEVFRRPCQKPPSGLNCLLLWMFATRSCRICGVATSSKEGGEDKRRFCKSIRSSINRRPLSIPRSNPNIALCRQSRAKTVAKKEKLAPLGGWNWLRAMNGLKVNLAEPIHPRLPQRNLIVVGGSRFFWVGGGGSVFAWSGRSPVRIQRYFGSGGDPCQEYVPSLLPSLPSFGWKWDQKQLIYKPTCVTCRQICSMLQGKVR